MEVNKIQEELARLIELVDGWAGSHDVPGIERDLVLDKLKKLYEAIRFANFDEGDSSASASVAAQQSVAEVAPVSEISIDLDDLLATPCRSDLGESAGVSAVEVSVSATGRDARRSLSLLSGSVAAPESAPPSKSGACIWTLLRNLSRNAKGGVNPPGCLGTSVGICRREPVLSLRLLLWPSRIRCLPTNLPLNPCLYRNLHLQRSL